MYPSKKEKKLIAVPKHYVMKKKKYREREGETPCIPVLESGSR
jgi:hypothetical protein